MPLQRENWSMIVSQCAGDVERLASAAWENHATRKQEINLYQFKPLKTWAGSPGMSHPPQFCHRIELNAIWTCDWLDRGCRHDRHQSTKSAKPGTFG